MTKLTTLLNRAVDAGSTMLNDTDPQKRVIRGINLMSLSIITLNITVGTFVYFISYNFWILAGITVETAILLLPPILNQRGRNTLAGMVVYAVMSFATLYYGCLFGRSVNAVLMIPYLMAISLFMFHKLHLRLICGGLAISILLFLEMTYQYEFIQPIKVTPMQEGLQRWSAYGAIIGLIIISYHLYAKNYRAALNQLQVYAREKESEIESKDKFISNASHEMRVSFKSIFAIINILRKQVELINSKELGIIVNDLQTSCDISQNIIDNILQYEKIQAGIMTPNRKNSFDARILFGKTTEVYQYLASENNIKITTQFDKSMPRHIIADDIKIRHIYTNILHNAIKFSSNDCEIIVSVQTVVNNLVFSVQDCGEGIADQSKIFEAFASTNPDGLGLGLYIVKELVNALRGHIEVKSDNNGTAFVIGIPLAITNEAAVIVQQERIT
jgi:signal transduction histidine kinase